MDSLPPGTAPASSEGGAGEAQGRVLRRVCVYCGSKPGRNAAYMEAAKALGLELARRGIGLVYGGGSVGLMGAVSSAVEQAGGAVTGVIPTALMPREISGTTVGTLIQVDDMHQRKAIMAREADAFIALPGGFGTLEELVEMITWSQLGFHAKPVGVLNTAGYYGKLLEFFDLAVEQGFVTPSNRNIVICDSDPAALLERLQDYVPTHVTLMPKENSANSLRV